MRQVDGGDSSDWTDPRAFEVVNTAFLIGATGSVVAHPVVSNHESVLLRVQVVASESWEGVEGLNVVWSVLEDMGVRATTQTDREGWAHYRLTPQVAGDYRVQADVTSENEGVDLTQVFDVTALADNPWSNAAELYLDGEKVDLALGELQLIRDKYYELELKVISDSPLIGSDVTLEDQPDAVNSGLECVPAFGVPQKVEVGKVRWTISSSSGNDCFFGLKLTSSVLPDWLLPGRLLSNSLAEDLDMYFDAVLRKFGGAVFPCHVGVHGLSIIPEPDSDLVGKMVTLHWQGDSAADLGIVVKPDPAIPQEMPSIGLAWTFNCHRSIKDGTFVLQLNLVETSSKSVPLFVSLAHNRVEVMGTFGPQYMGGDEPHYRYGVRARSLYSREPAANALARVEISGREPEVRRTGEDGWIYVDYLESESASITLISLYDEMISDLGQGT
ncbi:hypothetical protein D3C85_986920 [compost metagenome]